MTEIQLQWQEISSNLNNQLYELQLQSASSCLYFAGTIFQEKL